MLELRNPVVNSDTNFKFEVFKVLPVLANLPSERLNFLHKHRSVVPQQSELFLDLVLYIVYICNLNLHKFFLQLEFLGVRLQIVEHVLLHSRILGNFCEHKLHLVESPLKLCVVRLDAPRDLSILSHFFAGWL